MILKSRSLYFDKMECFRGVESCSIPILIILNDINENINQFQYAFRYQSYDKLLLLHVETTEFIGIDQTSDMCRFIRTGC